MARVLVVLARPLTVFDDVVLEDLHCFVIDVFPSEELSFFVHPHIDPDICVKTEHDEGFVVLLQVLQVLIEVIHRSRHDDGDGEVADALLVDGERNDLVWLVRKVKQPNTRDEKLESMKPSEDESLVVFSHENTVSVLNCNECSKRRSDKLEPRNQHQLIHNGELCWDISGQVTQ